MNRPRALDDFDRKLLLALNSKRSSVKTEAQLLTELRVQKDYFYRIRKGTRPLNEDIFEKICAATNIERELWYLELEAFGRELGLSRRQTAETAQVTLPGIDFVSRDKDPIHLRNLHSLLHGYWESYYYAVSKTDRKAISRDLCVIGDLNDDSFIDCKIIDGWFQYSGWCFPISHHLYFALEKQKMLNELIFYCTNKPDRFPPRLFGIIQCVSGGVEDTIPYPSASRVSFRFLGRSADEILLETKDSYATELRAELDKGSDLESALIKVVPKYVYPDEPLSAGERPFIEAIDNRILADTIPYALRMKE